MRLIDTHAHIHSEGYGIDAETVLGNARQAGVDRIICVGTTLADSKRAVDFAEKHENVWAAVGVHPHDAAHYLQYQQEQYEELTALAAHPRVVAIGEVGLDYYKNYAEHDTQKALFKDMLRLGVASGKPMIFHIREAFDDAWEMIDGVKLAHGGVIHSFSDVSKRVDEALQRGFYVGLNGIMTFTKDEAQLTAAKAVPLEKLVVETDAPYLTPKPFRGTMCEPKHVAVTVEFLSQLRGESMQQLADQTTRNAAYLFSMNEGIQ